MNNFADKILERKEKELEVNKNNKNIIKNLENKRKRISK